MRLIKSTVPIYRRSKTVVLSTVFDCFIMGCTGLIDGGIVDETNGEYMEHGLQYDHSIYYINVPIQLRLQSRVKRSLVHGLPNFGCRDV